MNRLDPDLQVAVALLLGQGVSIKETARRLKINRETVRRIDRSGLVLVSERPRHAEQRREIRQVRHVRKTKMCPWPTCNGRCSVRWSFCNKCQSERFRARMLGEVDGRPVTDEERALLDAVDQHKAHLERKWRTSPQAKARRREWIRTEKGQAWRRRYQERLAEVRRKYRAERERVRWRNKEYRDAALKQARENACEELLALIEEQQADSRERVRRTKNDPWMMRSLNAPLPGSPDLTLADLFLNGQDVWSDPTGDMATALADGDLHWRWK